MTQNSVIRYDSVSDRSQEYLSLLARQGKIAAIKVGRNWEINQEALDEYLSKISKNQ